MAHLRKSVDYYKNYDLGSINKNVLLKNRDLACGLARHNKDFGTHPLAQDYNVLILGEGGVAKGLAKNSKENGWGRTNAAQEMSVLMLDNGKVALWLARFSGENEWGMTEAVEKMGVLQLRFGEIALNLAKQSGSNGWVLKDVAWDPEVLKLCKGEVGKELILNSEENGWGEMLSIYRKEGKKLGEKVMKQNVIDNVIGVN